MRYLLIFLLLGLSSIRTLPAINVPLDYPNFRDNPFLNGQMKAVVAPYLLPLDHPMKATLDFIFSQSRVIENERTLTDAGFTLVAGPMPVSFIIVARHPAIPGYVFKIYLDSESRARPNIPHWLSLARRCRGARDIKKIIKHKHIKHFLIPDKWVYLPPIYPFSSVTNPEPILVMETDMKPESYEVTKQMWKTIVTREHLDELYEILKHGHGGNGTVCLSVNVPYVGDGKFAFLDTESPQSKLKLKNIKKYLSKDMEKYWDKLINQ